MPIRGERERLFVSREREGKLKIPFPFYEKGTGIRKCYGKGMGNLRLVIPGIPGIPGNHIKAKVKFNILFILCLDQPSAKLQIMIVFPVLIPGQNFLFPGTGREITKCHGKGREGKGNLRLVFPGITGNRNSRSPLVQTVRELFTHLNDLLSMETR